MASNSSEDSSPSSRSTTSVLRGSKLSPIIKSSMLRPSLFQNSSTSEESTTTTKTEVTNLNPFLRCPDEEVENTPLQNDNSDKKEEKSDPLSLLTKNGIPKSTLFSNTKTVSENVGFVFGQNVHERVTGEIAQTDIKKKDDDEATNSDGSAGLLFSSAAAQTTTTGETPSKETNSKSLTEAAREYEESRAQKRKYDEVETVTGEESEVNVLEVNCKLFAFVAPNYEELGRGCLRINDSKTKDGASRVVFRTAGNYRVYINTKIWGEMNVQRPSQKSLRLTAIDSSGHIKIFLLMARPEEINKVYAAIQNRIKLCDTDEDSIASKKDSSSLGDEPSPKRLVS